MQQWRKFLSCSSSKTLLIRFLSEEWKLPKYKQKLSDKVLYVTYEEGCYKLTEDRWEDVAELRSMQEQADICLVLHTQHASRDGYRSAIICADDIDIFILSLAMQGDMDISICQKFGTNNRTRYAEVKKIGRSLGHDVCNSLIGMHAYTGCDTVSCFAGKGKASHNKPSQEESIKQCIQTIWPKVGNLMGTSSSNWSSLTAQCTKARSASLLTQ